MLDNGCVKQILIMYNCTFYNGDLFSTEQMNCRHYKTGSPGNICAHFGYGLCSYKKAISEADKLYEDKYNDE